MVPSGSRRSGIWRIRRRFRCVSPTLHTHSRARKRKQARQHTRETSCISKHTTRLHLHAHVSTCKQARTRERIRAAIHPWLAQHPLRPREIVQLEKANAATEDRERKKEVCASRASSLSHSSHFLLFPFSHSLVSLPYPLLCHGLFQTPLPFLLPCSN